MEPSVHRYEGFEAIDPLCSTPRPTRQAFDVIAYHRIAVIKAEQRIPTTAFEFALPYYAAAATFISLMAKTFEMEGNWLRVVLAIIRFNDALVPNTSFEFD